MSRTCSLCGNNGHNSRTCTEAGATGGNGIMLFGVRVTEFRKSVSMNNLSQYDQHHDSNTDLAAGYASDDVVHASGRNRERKRGLLLCSLLISYVFPILFVIGMTRANHFRFSRWIIFRGLLFIDQNGVVLLKRDQSDPSAGYFPFFCLWLRAFD